ncbi:MAG: HPr kinase/phosphatase C-terminal domain-containing protein [Hyphomicrobiales bacterium]
MTMSDEKPAGILVHASCVAIGGYGIVLLGAPGSGKSDLALRLIDSDGRGVGARRMTARLVGDDQIYLSLCEGRVMASAPEVLAGRLEIRGLGVVSAPYARSPTPVICAARLDAETPPDRSPDFTCQSTRLCGFELPELRLNPFAPSAPSVLRAAIVYFTGDGKIG